MPLSTPPAQNPVATPAGTFRQEWQQWLYSVFTLTAKLRNDGSIEPAVLTDAQAVDNSLYYSSTQGKLCYKDTNGNVNQLY